MEYTFPFILSYFFPAVQSRFSRNGAKSTAVAMEKLRPSQPSEHSRARKKGNTALIEKVNAAIKELLVEDADGKTQIDKWYDQYAVIEPEE